VTTGDPISTQLLIEFSTGLGSAGLSTSQRLWHEELCPAGLSFGLLEVLKSKLAIKHHNYHIKNIKYNCNHHIFSYNYSIKTIWKTWKHPTKTEKPSPHLTQLLQLLETHADKQSL
jgi:hypothetical protein